MDGFVKKPDLLSFHIASKIPVSESIRQELLEVDGTSYRLRREINLLERFDRVRCKNCQVCPIFSHISSILHQISCILSNTKVSDESLCMAFDYFHFSG